MSDKISYSAVDYVVAATILMIPMGIGILYAVKDANKATRAEYLLGGRKMSFAPVAMSIFITFLSAVSLMGTPAEAFFYGGVVVSMYLGCALSYIIGNFTIVPLIYPLHLTSVYEYLKLRYQSETVRVVSAIIGMTTTLFYQAVVLLSPALALQACADLPLWMSLAVIGAIGTLYTAIGGFKSVIWTDVFQALVVFVGIFTIVIKACVEVGGIGEVWRLSEEGGRTKLDKFSLDPRERHTQWSLLIGICFVWLSNLFSQSTVQRISSMKTLRDAKIAFLLNVPFYVLYGVINVLVGFCIYAYYVHKKCDPYEGGLISNRNQLSPYFVLHAMTDIPGMAGLFMGVLCCGSLSSLSSGINAMAANTVEDILPRFLKSSSESTITSITKLFVIAYGALTIGVAYLAQSIDGPLTQLSAAIFGAFGSPFLGILLLGASVPWANKYGALAGVAVSLPMNLWISVGSVIQANPIKPLMPITTENCFEAVEMVNSSSSFSLSMTNQTKHTQYDNVFPNSSDSKMLNYTTTASHESKDTFFLYDITYEWYPLIGCTLCILSGLIVSYLTNLKTNNDAKRDKGDTSLAYVDARYIFPCLRSFWGMSDKHDSSENVASVSETEECLSYLKENEKYGNTEAEQLNPLVSEHQHPKIYQK